jgi:hypothetical protein
MIRFMTGLSVLLLLAACGAPPEEPQPAVALDVLPDETLLTFVVVNPAAGVYAMDSYAAGVPLLGESMVSGWLLTALDCADMQEVSAKCGIDTRGTVVVYLQSMMPQSLGAALQVSDPALFWATVGLQPVLDEPIGEQEVSSFDVDFGKIYTCGTRGLLLLAGSRAGLQEMLSRLDGVLPAGLPGLPDGSIYGYANVSTFGPMAAQQIEMFRPQILSEMQGTGGPNPEMTAQIMNLYFDAIGIMLTQTESADFIATFDPEYISVTSTADFVEGSDLAGIFVPVEVRDMTGMVPAGSVAAVRVSFDPAATSTLMNAVIGALGIDSVPPEMIDFWTACTRNTAISMMSDGDNPFSMVAVYEMPDGADIGQVMEMYQTQFGIMGRIMDLPGLTFAPVELVDLDGRQWVTFGMNLDMNAFTAGMAIDSTGSMPISSGGFSWTAWLTEADGLLYLEMGAEPVIVPALIQGTWTGQTAASMPEMAGFPPDAEMAMVINVPEYVNMAMGMSGIGLPRIDSEPVWMELDVDFQEGRVVHHSRVNGSSLFAFIGQAVQIFGTMAADPQ